jgi:hypothetical protein
MAYEMAGRSIYPLGDLFTSSEFPLGDLLPADLLAKVFDGLYYTEAQVVVREPDVVFDLYLAFEGELALTPPGVEDLALVLGGADGWTAIQARVQLGPEPSVALVDVPVALRVPATVLRDIATGGPAEIGMTATLELSATGGLELSTSDTISLAEAEIAGTGVTVSATDVRWNFDPGETLPEAAAAGLEGEFLGVAFRQATLKLPPDLVGGPELTLESCFIGTGGFTGGIRIDAPTPTAWGCSLGGVDGFKVDLQRVAVRFERSRLVLGEIQAILRDLDLFDTDVDVDLLLSGAGLRVALSASADRQVHAGTSVDTDGFLNLRKEGVISAKLTGAAIEVGPSGGALSLSGVITPEVQLLGGGKLPGFDVEALTITSAGQVSLAGGWIDMPNSIEVGLGGFGLEVTRVGMGSDPYGERWIGFSGQLSLIQGVAATAAVDGLKIRWDSTGFKGVELSGVKFGLRVQDVLVLEAEIRYLADQQRFDGAGTLQLPAINLTVTVRVVIGKRADYTYLYVYLLAQLPVGIPLFSTGLGLYGFEGLYARNMAPDKESAERWYRDWYRRPEIGAADQEKWADERGSQAFGAGVLIGTAADTGYSVAVKGLLVIVVPGPVLMLDVRANLLKKISEIAAPEAQALFGSLVVFDGRAGTLELGIEPHYMYPEKGQLIDVTGIAEAFYSFNDPRAWYLYLGRREREQRIRARLFSLFDANTYLMLDANSIELGGFIGWALRYEVGPVALTVQASIEGFAYISWRPKQVKGQLSLQGAVGVSVFGIGLSLSVAAMVAAQAPQPFVIDAALQVRLDLPWPIPDLEAKIPFHWEDPGPPRVTAPLQAAGIEHLSTKTSWPFGETPTVPLDGRISLGFERPVEDFVKAAPNADPPTDLTVGDYSLRSRLTGLRLDVFDTTKNAFVPYASPDGKPRKLYGMWQPQAGDPTAGNRRLQLYVRTPYEWTRAQTEPAITQLERADEFDPCVPSVPAEVIDFHDQADRELRPLVPYDDGTITWTAGRYGAKITQLATLTFGLYVPRPPPRPYSRCLVLPDELAITLEHGGGSAGGSAATGTTTTASPSLLVEFDGDQRGLAVLALAMDTWSLEAFDAAGKSLGKMTASPPPTTQFHASQLVLRAQGIRRVAVDSRRQLAILALAIQGAPAATEVSKRREVLEQALERFKGEEPIFEPNRRYQLTLTTEVVEIGGRPLAGAEVDKPDGAVATISKNTCTLTQTFEFRTEGPPGAAQLSPLGSDPDARSNLDTLEPYVREILPPRGAAAVYRDYDLGVAFNADYVDQMYRADQRTLVLRLRGDDGREVTVTNTMGKGNEVALRREERKWLTTLSRSSCKLTVDESKLVRESIVKAQLPVSGPLDPCRRYDVELIGAPAPGSGASPTPPLYRWSFVTSAFRNFADHLRLTGGMRLALVRATWAQWNAAASQVLASDDPWTADPRRRPELMAIETAAFGELFGQIDMERSLPGVVELYAAMVGAETWAMVLSSPEPFDWERVQLVLTPEGVPPGQRVPIPLRPIRDTDGARALLVPHDGASASIFKDGQYQLAATFKRDLGGGRPVLSERGSRLDEQVTLDWALPIA